MLSEYPRLATRGRVPKSLLPAVLSKLKDAIDNDVFIPIYPAKSASRQFFHRQFWAAFKLLKNVLAWRDIIGDTRLQEICMGALLGRYLLAALRTCDPMDALEKSRYVSHTSLTTNNTILCISCLFFLSDNLANFFSFWQHFQSLGWSVSHSLSSCKCFPRK
jgi:hypothetical protein